MIKNLEYEISINTMVFLINNTNNCSKSKLLKLLKMFDEEHYSQRGYPATEIKYLETPTGKFASELNSDIKSLVPDLDGLDINNPLFGCFDVRISKSSKGLISYKITPKIDCDLDVFTSRQLSILDSLVKKFKNSLSNEIK